MPRRRKSNKPKRPYPHRWHQDSMLGDPTPNTAPPSPIPPFLSSPPPRRFKNTLNISNEILGDIERCVERFEDVTRRAGGAVVAREPFERRSPRNALHHLNAVNDFASTLSHRLEQALDTIEQLL